MSFVTPRDIQSIVQGFITQIWDKALGIQLDESTFRHMTYHEAMTKVRRIYLFLYRLD